MAKSSLGPLRDDQKSTELLSKLQGFYERKVREQYFAYLADKTAELRCQLETDPSNKTFRFLVNLVEWSILAEDSPEFQAVSLETVSFSPL